MQIRDVKNALTEKQRSLTTATAQDCEPDDQLGDTMLAAYWAAVKT